MRRRAGSPARSEAPPDASSTRRTSLPRVDLRWSGGRGALTARRFPRVPSRRSERSRFGRSARRRFAPCPANQARGRCGDPAIMLSDSGREDGVTCHAGAGQGRCTTESVNSPAWNTRSRAKTWRSGNALDRSGPAAEPDLMGRGHSVERRTFSSVSSCFGKIHMVSELFSQKREGFWSVWCAYHFFSLLVRIIKHIEQFWT